MLAILEEVCSRLKANETVPKEHLENIVDFMRIFVDKCHHGKEEDLLFPEMAKAGISKEHGPIGVMLSEHERGRQFIRGMSESLLHHGINGEKSPSAFIEHAKNYTSLLAGHIEKENNVLFPLGEKVLSEGQKRMLAEGFDKLEKERIGEGKHEEFHRLLKNLKEIYLGQS